MTMSSVHCACVLPKRNETEIQKQSQGYILGLNSEASSSKVVEENRAFLSAKLVFMDQDVFHFLHWEARPKMVTHIGYQKDTGQKQSWEGLAYQQDEEVCLCSLSGRWIDCIHLWLNLWLSVQRQILERMLSQFLNRWRSNVKDPKLADCCFQKCWPHQMHLPFRKWCSYFPVSSLLEFLLSS